MDMDMIAGITISGGTIMADMVTAMLGIRTAMMGIGTVMMNMRTDMIGMGTAMVNIGTAMVNIGTAMVNIGTAMKAERISPEKIDLTKNRGDMVHKITNGVPETIPANFELDGEILQRVKDLNGEGFKKYKVLNMP